LLGYGNFRDQHENAHALMTGLKIAHEYRDGPARKHDWHSGWVVEAMEAEFRKQWIAPFLSKMGFILPKHVHGQDEERRQRIGQ
jgi:hypothetical protein